MTKNNFGEKLLKKIKQQKIMPKPRWTFLLKNYVIWLLGIICLIIGGLAWAVIIYMMKNSDWAVYRQVSGGLFKFILMILPYYWLIFLGLLIFVVYYNIRHTKKGYRYNLLIIVVGSVVFSLLLGTLLYNLGLGQVIDGALGKHIPFYQRRINFINQHKRIWGRPEQGLLVGAIVKIIDEQHFQLKDFQGKIWEIDTKETFLSPMLSINLNEQVKIVGQLVNNNNFKAERLMSFMPPKHKIFGRPSNCPRTLSR